ncbi:hypothetical protein ETD86_45575 [Nonomuraea turkmeniaca]|uniref:Uncharacterized protein n=1 Tax=Nonomuraea turkmeniaca TaxID=103838 RepID=A0A5S4EZI7_9ACTN|nr:DUF5994 family protein [Nonomuraea turkmeniaca]TMR08947.1 hypothetical protein ETD86_45575 [Nonomuraea turkmeniaca]
MFLEPTLTRDGTLDGAWWPYSTDLHRELPALVRILEDRLGPILRVRLDPDAWDDVPAHLLIDGRFLRVSGLSAASNTIRVIRGNQDGFQLLVIPPDTTGPIAAAAMRTAARTGNTMSANEILTRCHSPAPAAGTGIRRYRDSDRESVLALIDADRLPGQPSCRPELLDQAVAGTSHREPDPWADIEHPRTVVLVDPGGHTVGAVSYAVNRDRSAGQILWLHGREILDVVEALVSHALRELGGGKPVHAFTAALGLGLAALPTGRRPVTRKVLEHAGFGARNSWRYLRRVTSCELAATTCPLVEVVASTAPPGWWLKVRDDDSAAELVVQEPIDGLGVLWWFGAADSHADPALERALLLQADAVLREHGASETILYVAGDPEPPGALFDAAGFAEIDHLVSFTRPNNAAAD